MNALRYDHEIQLWVLQLQLNVNQIKLDLRSMKVLFLSEVLYPHGSGGDLSTYLYAKHLARSGFNVTVITNRFSGETRKSKSDNLIVYRLPLLKSTRSVKYSMLERFDLLFSTFIRKLMRRTDVVYIPKYWYLAIPFAKSYRKPVITHFHAYFPVCPIASLYDLSRNTICNGNSYFCSAKCIITNERNDYMGLIDALLSSILNLTSGHWFCKLATLSDAMIFVSGAQRDLMTARKPFMRKKSYVIHNLLPKSPNPVIEGKDFGYFGGLSPLKGFKVLCRALTQVNHQKVSVHATKVHELAQSVTDSLAELGIISYRKLNEENFKRIYKLIRTVIVPSIWPEPWGYVVTEAILGGRLVIASRVGGIPEQVEGCQGVYLFRPGNDEELADLIEFIRSLDRENMVNLGLQNREAFLKRHDTWETLRSFEKVLNKVSE